MNHRDNWFIRSSLTTLTFVGLLSHGSSIGHMIDLSAVVLYDGSKCHFEGEMVKMLKKLPFWWSIDSFLHFSAWCQCFCCCLSSQAWQTSHSSLQWLHSCRRQFLKWIFRPFCLTLIVLAVRAVGLCLELISPCHSWFHVKANCSHFMHSWRCALIFKSEMSFNRQKWILLMALLILQHINN